MESEYSGYKFFNELTTFINLGLIKSDQETDIKYDFHFNIQPPDIDTWASNYAKTTNDIEQEENLIDPNKANERQKRKQIEKEQEAREKEELKKAKSLMEVMKTSPLLSWDMDGRFLQVKPINQNQFKEILQINSKVKDIIPRNGDTKSAFFK